MTEFFLAGTYLVFKHKLFVGELLYPGYQTCTGALVRGLSPRTGGQPKDITYYICVLRFARHMSFFIIIIFARRGR